MLTIFKIFSQKCNIYYGFFLNYFKNIFNAKLIKNEKQEQKQQETDDEINEEIEYTIEDGSNNREIIPMNNSIKRDENSIVYKCVTKFVAMRWDNNIINVYENEKKWLKLFKHSKHLPKLIYCDDIARCIITQYCGENISIKNIPNNIMQQAEELVLELTNYNCMHNDIKPQELLINNNTLYLVDFGWAHEIDKPTPPIWPSCLGGSFKPPSNYLRNDSYSLYLSLDHIFSNIIKNILLDIKKSKNNINKILINANKIYKKNIPRDLTGEEEENWWKEYIIELSKPTIYFIS